MALTELIKRQSTLTALGACLFVAGVALLFFTIFHETSRSGPLPWLAGALLIATVACWAASARAGKASA